ncbi:unnamed protein product [Chrysodeixis includens]|uniref:Uncharacterized protein n=1 Tax=Chrysodeixis includens TaxID=689277 RepID=A0A9N8KW31_CHRIL|nr:unnamed protein product [Chrysodeixis includens]
MCGGSSGQCGPAAGAGCPQASLRSHFNTGSDVLYIVVVQIVSRRLRPRHRLVAVVVLLKISLFSGLALYRVLCIRPLGVEFPDECGHGVGDGIRGVQQVAAEATVVYAHCRGSLVLVEVSAVTCHAFHTKTM